MSAVRGTPETSRTIFHFPDIPVDAAGNPPRQIAGMIATFVVLVSVTALTTTDRMTDSTRARPGEVISLPSDVIGERGASSGTYGKDSDEILFMIWPPDAPKILVSKRGVSGWRTPLLALADFPGRALGPAVAPDGNTLYFESSYRPADSTRRDTDLWVARRIGDAWAEPSPLGAPFNSQYQEHNVTVSARGTICFNSSRPGGQGEHDI